MRKFTDTMFPSTKLCTNNNFFNCALLKKFSKIINFSDQFSLIFNKIATANILVIFSSLKMKKRKSRKFFNTQHDFSY